MTIEERLERLERQNTRLKTGLISLFAAAMAVGLFAFTQPEQIPDVVQARAFHVVGKDGMVLVMLEDTFGLGGGIAGTLSTFDGEGRELVSLGATAEGEGTVTTMNGKGQELVSLNAGEGGGSVTTLNGKGQKLVILGATEGGQGTVTTMNGKGQKLVRIGTNRNGHGLVQVLDPSSVRAAGILAPR